MEGDFAKILFFFVVIGIPVIAGVFADIYKRRLRFREKEMEVLGTQTAERAAHYATRVAELEQRVRVLERILTDGGVQTAAQIEALRDGPFAPDRVSAREAVR